MGLRLGNHSFIPLVASGKAERSIPYSAMNCIQRIHDTEPTSQITGSSLGVKLVTFSEITNYIPTLLLRACSLLISIFFVLDAKRQKLGAKCVDFGII